MVSRDEGATWQVEAPDWFRAMKQEEKYIIDMDMAADGTMAVLYNSGWAEEYDPTLMLVLPDGTQVPVGSGTDGGGEQFQHAGRFRGRQDHSRYGVGDSV